MSNKPESTMKPGRVQGLASAPETQDCDCLLSDAKPNCLFRFDASPSIGGGHAVRCMALAEAMRRAGWHCAIVCHRQTLEIVPSLKTAGFPVMFLEGEAEQEPETIAARLHKGIELLVVDHYERDASFEATCRAWARHIAVIDDIPSRRHDCDILVDQTMGRDASSYVTLVSPGCHVFVGVEYAMLRPEFSAARPAALKRRGEQRQLDRLLVSLGAVDEHNLTEIVLKAVSASGAEVSVDVVLGSNAPHRKAVELAHERLPGGGSVYAFVDDMATLMAEADLAVGAAGSASWERCCLGLPTLMYVLADNQVDIAERLSDIGAAESLGRADEASAERLSDRIQQLVREQDHLVQMSAVAASVCDGRGSGRLASALSDCVGLSAMEAGSRISTS